MTSPNWTDALRLFACAVPVIALAAWSPVALLVVAGVMFALAIYGDRLLPPLPERTTNLRDTLRELAVIEAMHESANRMIASCPPWDGNERRHQEAK